MAPVRFQYRYFGIEETLPRVIPSNGMLVLTRQSAIFPVVPNRLLLCGRTVCKQLDHGGGLLADVRRQLFVERVPHGRVVGDNVAGLGRFQVAQLEGVHFLVQH